MKMTRNRSKFLIAVVTAVIVITAFSKNSAFGYVVPDGEECPPEEDLCEFLFDVEERLVVRHKDTTVVPMKKKSYYNTMSRTFYAAEEEEEVCYLKVVFLLLQICT